MPIKYGKKLSGAAARTGNLMEKEKKRQCKKYIKEYLEASHKKGTTRKGKE